MPYECRYPAVSAAVYEALLGDPFYDTLRAAAAGDSSSAMVAYLDYSLVEAERHGILTLCSGVSLGAAAWMIPLQPALQESVGRCKKKFIVETMGTGCVDLYRNISANMHAATRPQVDSRSWYLSIVGVQPQGQGAGRSLLKRVLGRSDAAGVPTYLETFTPRNIPFYKRLGYREVAIEREPCIDASYSVMVRDPA